MRNFLSSARATWRSFTPFVRETITVILACVLLFAIVSVASAQTVPNATSTFQTGHTGFWYEPANSGSGMSITVDQAGVVAAAVYTFSPTTIPTLLPGLQAGDPIEGANHLFMVGATSASVGEYQIEIPLSMPVYGGGFMEASEGSYEFGELTLTVVTCDRIDYQVSVWSGFPTSTPGIVQTTASGTLQRLTSGGGTCALDCRYPDFGPFPAQCPAR